MWFNTSTLGAETNMFAKQTPFDTSELAPGSFIRLALSESRAKKKIVVSHTVPTELCIPKKYKDSQLNPAFVVELHDFIFDSGIDYWLYGYSHYNMPETVINKTRLLCNQLGYVKYNEHLSFRNDVVVEL